MSVVVFTQRYVKPEPPNQLEGWGRYELRWYGWDGSVWDLRNVSGGVFVTNEGIIGLDDPTFEAQTTASPVAAGRWRQDYRVTERPVTLPVYIYNDDGSAAWQDLQRRFRHSFHPLKPGTLWLRTPLGIRTLELYLDGGGDFAYTRDPLFEGHSRYSIRLTAEDPFWKGEPVTYDFATAAPEPFFGVDGNLHVATSSSTSSAQLTNDGDESIWLRYVITAGVADIDVSITLDGGEIGPPVVPAGQTLIIDTDPAVGSADLNGVEVDGLVDPWDPRPLPPGENLPVNLDLSGFGTVSIVVQPRYWRGL